MSNQSSQPINLAEFIRTNLNEQQQQAVTHMPGSLLVVAGAGSGKTRVITARIAYLMLHHEAPASSILALTFTNKAAQEMRARIASFLAPDMPVPFVGTFHAYCLRLLKQYAHLLDKPFASILDADDARLIIDGIIKRNNLQKITTAKAMQYQISLYKNQSALSRNDPLFMQLYAAYEQEKNSNQCLDFDDLLLHILRLFTKNEQFRDAFHAKIQHILIDEYQDTNAVQHELLKCMALAGPHTLSVTSLCAVGDEDQSIYSWRGATVSNIMNFNKDFPTTTIIKIEQNYRSNQQILDAANAVIGNNAQRTPKRLWSAKKGTDRIRTIMCNSEYQEADTLVAFFASIARKDPHASRAVLYRAHFQSQAIEEALVKNSLPYVIIGGIQFYERREIKDLLAYLRLVCNPFDRISFLRALQCPPRGLGEKFIEYFRMQWDAHPHESFIQIAQRILADTSLAGVRTSALAQFIKIFDVLKADSTPEFALDHVIKMTNYIPYLQKNEETEEAKERLDNIKELSRAMQHMHDQGITTLTAFLDEVTLMQEKQDKATDSNPIYLMTLHTAKGLEFDAVALVGLEEGVLPSTRSSATPEALEEERRLFYVGITRCQEYLLLSHCANRYTYGTLSPQSRSRFLEEVPLHLAPSTRFAHMHQAEVRNYFTTWLHGTTSTTSSSPAIQTFKTQRIHTSAQQEQPTITPQKKNGAWKNNQLVQHTKFGIGMIVGIEQRGNDTPSITVRFKSATKKIAAHFLQPV